MDFADEILGKLKLFIAFSGAKNTEVTLPLGTFFIGSGYIASGQISPAKAKYTGASIP